MRISRTAVIATLLFSSATLATVAHAGGKSAGGGASASSPGHQEKLHPTDGPGASQYAPGHLEQQKPTGGPGASQYAPGQQNKPPKKDKKVSTH